MHNLEEKYSFKKTESRKWQGNKLGSSGAVHELHCDGEPTGITLTGLRDGGYLIKHTESKVGVSSTFEFAKDKAINHYKTMTESIELDEAIKLGSKVIIHAPGKDYHQQVGYVGEIRHGLYKGAPKTYTVDYGNRQSIQLDKRQIKMHIEEVKAVHPIRAEYDDLKKQPIKTLRDMIKQSHRIIDTSDIKTKDHAASMIVRSRYGDKKVADAFGLSEGSVKTNLKQHYDKWVSGPDAPQDDDGGDDARVHKLAMSHLSGTNVPKDQHDELAWKMTNRYHGVNEAMEKQKHIVSVTLSDPNHTMVSKRKELIQRKASVSATSKDSAVDAAINFYKKQGYKVHDHNYVGLKESADKEPTKNKTDVPFDGPYTKASATVTDKSGAKHTTYSRVRDLANKAMKKQVEKQTKNEDLELDEARKLIGTYSHGDNTSKVYKLSGEHNEGDDYHVKLFKSGTHYEPADYFTNDHDDAHSTAKHMASFRSDVKEGIVSKIRSVNYTRLSNRAAKKALTSLDKANKLDPSDPEKASREAEFDTQMTNVNTLYKKATDLKKEEFELEEGFLTKKHIELAQTKHKKDKDLQQMVHNYQSAMKSGDHEEAKLHGSIVRDILHDKEMTESAAYQKDMDEKKPVIAQGVRGAKSTPFSKKFKSMNHYSKWSESEEASNYEVHHVVQEEVELDEGFKISKEHSVETAHPEANAFAKEYTAANRGNHRMDGPTDKDNKAYDAFHSKYEKTTIRAGFAGSGTHHYTNKETGEKYEVMKYASGRGFYGTNHLVKKISGTNESALKLSFLQMRNTLAESRMSELHSEIGNHLDKHITNFKQYGGSEALMGHADTAAKKISRKYKLPVERAHGFVRDYIDSELSSNN